MTEPTLMSIEALWAAVSAARESRLFDALAQRSRTCDELARELELDADATGRLLTVLQEWGLLLEDAGRLVLSPALRKELAGPVGLSELNRRVWSHLPEFLRTGRALQRGAPQAREESYKEVVGRLGAMFERAAGRLADVLGAELAPGSAILDVGAGSGVWSLALLERLPGARVTALDLPGVLPRFEEAASARGLQDRVDVFAGDYLSVDPGERRWDVILLANVLHLEPAERAEQLLQRIGRWLKADGLVIVVDALPGVTESSRRTWAAYTLHLGLRLPGARPHDELELRRWLAQLARTNIGVVELEPGTPLSAMVARP